MGYQTVYRVIIIAAVSALLCGCRYDVWNPAFWHTDAAPTGQVIATVGSHEITTRDLQAELQGATFSDSKTRKEAEEKALQAIVRRTIIADAATDQGIQNTPEYVLEQRKDDQLLLIKALEGRIARQVPDPSEDDARQFVANNPDMFDQRKIFVVNQIRTVPVDTLKVAKELKPYDSLDTVAAFLTKEKIPFQRGVGQIDAATQSPQLVSAIMKMASQEVFIVGDRAGGLLINQIQKTEIAPMASDAAQRYALNYLKARRQEQVIANTFHSLIEKAQSDVKYSKDFTPPVGPASRNAAVGAAE